MTKARTIEDQAAHWLLRREERSWTDEDQVELDTWLGEAVAHKAAYWRLKSGWRAADRLQALRQGSMTGAVRPKTAPSKWHPALAASLVAALSVAGLSGFDPSRFENGIRTPDGTEVKTSIGGRKIVHLGDGSEIDLNTASSVRVVLSKRRRDVWLDGGEAFFEVAHDLERPFVVHAGLKEVIVLGTRFAVRREGSKVTVSVLEGRVRIRDTGTTGEASAIATGGTIAIAERNTTLVASNAREQVERVLSWRRGALVFDNTTLAGAAAEFNRYNDRKIVISDPSIQNIRVGGTFSPTNAEAFTRILGEAYGFEVQTEPSRITISKT